MEELLYDNKTVSIPVLKVTKHKDKATSSETSLKYLIASRNDLDIADTSLTILKFICHIVYKVCCLFQFIVQHMQLTINERTKLYGLLNK